MYNSAGEGFPLEVAEACSGMHGRRVHRARGRGRVLSCRQWWHRVAVVLLAVPVAVFMNIVRVAVLAAITLVNPDFSVGGAHAHRDPAACAGVPAVHVLRLASEEDHAGRGRTLGFEGAKS